MVALPIGYVSNLGRFRFLYCIYQNKTNSQGDTDPLVEKSHLLDRSDPSHCYIKMAFLTALLTKSRSLYRQKQSMSSDIGLRNDFLELLSKIVGIVKTGIFTEDMGDHLEPEEMYVELLVQVSPQAKLKLFVHAVDLELTLEG